MDHSPFRCKVVFQERSCAFFEVKASGELAQLRVQAPHLRVPERVRRTGACFTISQLGGLPLSRDQRLGRS